MSRHNIAWYTRVSKDLDVLTVRAAKLRGITKSEFIRLGVKTLVEETMELDVDYIPITSWSYGDEN